MRDTDYYRRQMHLYNEIYNKAKAERITMTGRQFLEMANMVITIHRPDKLSPKKKMNEFRFK